MDRRQLGLRNEKADQDIFGRQQRHDRRPGGHGFSGARQNIRDAARRRRRRDLALPQPVIGLGLQRPRGLDGCTLRLDFLVPAQGCPRLRQRCFQRLDPRLSGARGGAIAVDDLSRDGAGGEQLLAALEVAPGAVQCGFCVGEIGFGLVDFGRFAAGLQIRQPLFRLGKLARRLIVGVPVLRIVLRE